MEWKDIDDNRKHEIKEKCSCGKIHTILGQRDYMPEYIVDIYVLCECGQYLEFLLPCN